MRRRVMAEHARVWLAVRRLDAALSSRFAGPGVDSLSAAEQARARGITAPHRRAQFIAARCLARELLAAGWGGTSHDWALSAPLDGPPEVTRGHGGAAPRVSISHSGDWLACAASDSALGVDIEAPARERDVAAMARAICTAGELERFDALPTVQRNARFYALWTLKEAWIKRDAAPATPGRMARIDAIPAPVDAPERCAGRTWQHGRLTLALVSSGGIPTWHGPQPFDGVAAQGWALRDGEPRAVP